MRPSRPSRVRRKAAPLSPPSSSSGRTGAASEAWAKLSWTGIAKRDALAALERGMTVTRHYGPRGEARREELAVFFEVFAAPSCLIIFGAVDFTRALVEVGKVIGFAVTVCDARPVFATKARFPRADEIVVDWPDRYLERVGASLGPRDAVCVLTHDTKFDVPAVLAALRTRSAISARWALGAPMRRGGPASSRRERARPSSLRDS